MGVYEDMQAMQVNSVIRQKGNARKSQRKAGGRRCEFIRTTLEKSRLQYS